MASIKARLLTKYWVKSIQSTPSNPSSLRHVLIIFFQLCLVLSIGHSPKVSPSKPCMHLSCLPVRATCHAHLMLLDLITQIIFGEEYQLQGESLARGPKLMSMCTVEQRGFLFRKYWQTGSFKACQTAFRTEFGERRAPSVLHPEIG